MKKVLPRFLLPFSGKLSFWITELLLTGSSGHRNDWAGGQEVGLLHQLPGQGWWGIKQLFQPLFQHWYQHLIWQFSLQLQGRLSHLLQLADFFVLQLCNKIIKSLQCCILSIYFVKCYKNRENGDNEKVA